MGTGEADDVVSGRSHDRQWAVLMSASGQLRGRLRAVSRGRRQAALAGLGAFGEVAVAAMLRDEGDALLGSWQRGRGPASSRWNVTSPPLDQAVIVVTATVGDFRDRGRRSGSRSSVHLSAPD